MSLLIISFSTLAGPPGHVCGAHHSCVRDGGRYALAFVFVVLSWTTCSFLGFSPMWAAVRLVQTLGRRLLCDAQTATVPRG